MPIPEIAVVQLGESLKPYNAQFDRAVHKGLSLLEPADKEILDVVLFTGQKRTASGDPLIEVPEQRLHHAIVHYPVGGRMGTRRNDLIAIFDNLTDRTIGATGEVAWIGHIDGRDDSTKTKKGKYTKLARGRLGTSQLARDIRQMKTNLNGRQLAAAFPIEPHCQQLVDRLTELTPSPDQVIPLTLAERYAQEEAMKDVTAVVSPDESAVYLNWLFREELQKKTGKEIPLYFFRKVRKGVNQAEVEELTKINLDGSATKAERQQLQGFVVAQIDDCGDTTRTAKANITALFRDAGIKGMHFCYAAPILSTPGTSVTVDLLKTYGEQIHIYTSDILPHHALVSQRIRDTEPTLAHRFHVLRMAPAVAAITRHIAGVSTTEDEQMIMKMLPGRKFDKAKTQLDMVQTGGIRFPKPEVLQAWRNHQLKIMGTIFQHQLISEGAIAIPQQQDYTSIAVN